jgi:GTPase SAR1 family protein
MLKVILLGDGGIGKSSLMNVFVSGKFSADSFHTVGVEFLVKEIVVDGENVALQIWDTAGQERYRSLRTPFYRGSDCCLLTFAVDNAKSFENLAMWQHEFVYYSDIGGGSAGDVDVKEASAAFPFVVIGNKVDVGDKRVVSTEKAADWCRQHGLPYYETSALDMTNVDAAFEAVVRRVRNFDSNLDSLARAHTDTINLSAKGIREGTAVSGNCC